MKNRLLNQIDKIQKRKEKIFCAFLTLGYPNLKSSAHLIELFDQEGVDIVELGFPFSDPMADGPTIQFSSEKALEKKIKVKDAFQTVSSLRKKGVKVPIIFFSYLNPIFHYGFKRFVKEAKASGFDGVIIPDLPPDEEVEFQKECHRHGLSQIFLVTPTTEKARAKMISAKSSGFVYYVSLRGVTGARKQLPSHVKADLAKFKSSIRKPVLIGFGVSSPDQAKSLSQVSAGVIVGSAIVNKIRESGGSIHQAVSFVRKMVAGVKGKRI